jgi:hypothetical protein
MACRQGAGNISSKCLLAPAHPLALRWMPESCWRAPTYPSQLLEGPYLPEPAAGGPLPTRASCACGWRKRSWRRRSITLLLLQQLLSPPATLVLTSIFVRAGALPLPLPVPKVTYTLRCCCAPAPTTLRATYLSQLPRSQPQSLRLLHGDAPQPQSHHWQRPPLLLLLRQNLHLSWAAC